MRSLSTTALPEPDDHRGAFNLSLNGRLPHSARLGTRNKQQQLCSTLALS